MPSARNRAETPNTDGERRSLVHRILALPTRLLAAAPQHRLLTFVLLSGTTIILGSGISTAYYLVTHGPSSDRNVTIEAALSLLDEGDYENAKLMALRLRQKIDGDYRQLGHPLFIQGAALTEEAKCLVEGEERQKLFLVAARYLEESRDRGFPPNRERQGLYLLASSLFNAGQYAESLEPLHEARGKFVGQEYEIASLLSTAYLRDSAPNLKQALHYNHIWLENPSLTKTERDDALLQLAEITLALQDTATCRDVISKIDEASPVHDQALMLLGRVLVQEGDELAKDASAPTEEAKAKYSQAIDVLGRAQSKDTLGTTTRQSFYWLGICHQKQGDLRAAKEAFEATSRKYYRTPEALAATLAEAEIMQQSGHDDEAAALYVGVLEEAGDPAFYKNSWVTLGELRGRVSAGQRRLMLNQQFESALSVADAFPPIFAADSTAEAKAEAHEAWATQLLADAKTMGNGKGEQTRAEARRQFRLAADQYHKLADLRFATDEYPTALWKSGHCFLQGQNYELAIRMLREQLNNVPRRQAAQALTSLGECQLALGRYHEAISTLKDCIEYFPKHPESYRARILASLAYRETGKLSEAETLLIDNLHNSSLDPRSRHWQESLLLYGKLLYQQAVDLESQSRNPTLGSSLTSADETLKEAHDLFQESIDSLQESVSREEQIARDEGREPDSAEARYYIAEAYHHSANQPRRSLETEPTQTRRNTLKQQMRAHLQAAARSHLELQNQLVRKQNQTELTPIEQAILRNTFFAHANVLFALEEYDKAITAYAAATNRYQNEPEALEALLQMASCYRRLGSSAEARGTILQAKSVLERIRKDADFTKTTRYNQTEWTQLIGWLSQL